MNIKEEVKQVEKEVQEISLASEMLKELKQQNKRQHITIIVLIIAVITVITGFLIYENQFETVEETYMTQTQQNIDDSNMSGVIN